MFDGVLIKSLVDAEVLQAGQRATAPDIFEFERFKGTDNRWTNFSKYVLMRIDRWLATVLDKPGYASESLDKLGKTDSTRITSSAWGCTLSTS